MFRFFWTKFINWDIPTLDSIWNEMKFVSLNEMECENFLIKAKKKKKKVCESRRSYEILNG